MAVDPPWAAVADRTTHNGVFLYNLTPTGWRLTQSILAPDTAQFGDSVAFDGDTLVVGSPWWDYLGERKGKVFVYERAGSQWSLAQELQPPGLRYDDSFGDAVAIDGDVIVAGAPKVDSPDMNQGAVFIYERNGTSWDLASAFRYEGQPATSQSEVELGKAVAVSGDTVVAGARGAELSGTGEVWVFEREATGWRHTASLKDPTPTAGDSLGKSVAIFGDTIVAGEGGQPTGVFQCKQGTALIFERGIGGTWHLVQEIEASDGFGNTTGSDHFAAGVSMEGERIVVSAPNSNTNGPQGKGAVYLFRRGETGAWREHETEVYITSDPTENLSGSNVALGGSVVLLGAIDPFSVYVFEVEAGTSFCAPTANSTGKPGHLAAVFSLEGEGVLSVHDAPPLTLGAFLVSPNRDEIAFQPSSLCLGAGMWRLDPIVPTGNAGVAIHELDLGASSGLLSGVTFYFQYWFEDPSAAVGTFNFTNAVAVMLP